MPCVSNGLRSRLLRQRRGFGTHLWVGVNRSVKHVVFYLINSLPSPGTIVAGSEHSEFELGRSQRDEAASEAVAVLPEAACHAITTALLPLQHLLAGQLVVCVLRHPGRNGSALEENVSVQEGDQLAGVAYRAAIGAESGLG
jgi:hypothetical protein